MNLLELADKQNQFIKLLIYGDSGAGKTTLAAAFPKPMLFLDFDGKVNSAASYYKNTPEVIKDIEVKQMKASLVLDPIVEFMQVAKDLETQVKQNKLKYKTLVLDSLTTFSKACLQHIVNTNPGIKRNIFKQGAQPGMQDYGILRREFSRMIPGILSLDMNIIMIGHIKTEKDELTGAILNQVMLDGSFGQDLPIYFEEVYLAKVNRDGSRVLQTQSDNRYKCRSQRGLAKEIPMTVESIMG